MVIELKKEKKKVEKAIDKPYAISPFMPLLFIDII